MFNPVAEIAWVMTASAFPPWENSVLPSSFLNFPRRRFRLICPDQHKSQARWTSGLEPVAKFYDVHVHAETGRSVQAGIGEVLDAKPGVGMRQWISADPRGRDDLNRSPEVLCTERVIAEESCPSADVEGDKPSPAAQRKIRHNRHHETALICPCQQSCACDHSRV